MNNFFQFKLLSKDNQLPPLMEEINHQKQSSQTNNTHQKIVQSQIFFINLSKIGYEETVCMVTQNEVTVRDLKQIIYNKYQKYIPKPKLWRIDDQDKEYDNNQLLKEIQSNLKLYACLQSETKIKQFANKSNPQYQQYPKENPYHLGGRGKQIVIQIEYPEIGKTLNAEVMTDAEIGSLLYELNDRFQVDPLDSKFYCSGRCLDPQITFDSFGYVPILIYQVHRFGGCFPGFAPVMLSDRSTKQIKDVQIGDIVLSYDIVREQFISSKIIATHQSKVGLLISIITTSRIITTTPNHPFFTKEGWKAVQPHPQFQIKSLTKEDYILNASNNFEQIISIENQYQKEKQKVYNVTTGKPNSYIVFGYVVHNMNKINLRIQGKIVELEILPDMVIYNIKVLIQLQFGYDVDQQRLYIGQKQLENFEILQNYFSVNDKFIETIDVKISLKQRNQINQDFFFINFISHDQSLRLILNNNCKYVELENLIKVFEINTKQPMILSKQGQIVNEDKIDLPNLKDIESQLILIAENKSINFNKQIGQINQGSLQKLQDSFNFLKNQQCQEIQQFIQSCIEFINSRNCEHYKKHQLYHIISIMLWTSNIVYQQINIDLRRNTYDRWKVYLKYLIEALRLCSYYKGSSFRGIKNYQNTELYQLGKTLQVSEFSCISKDLSIAESFSNNQGMLLEFDQRSSKDIEEISMFPHEQEVILPPFSQFTITDVIQEHEKPIKVKLREIPQPRWFKVLLWLDDNPENNYILAEELEIKCPDISVVFCISTDEAIDIIQQNKWMIYLDKQNFRIVTDMVREENGVLNYYAGVEFIYHMIEILKLKNEILLFCGDKKEAQQNCLKKNVFGDFIITNQMEELIKFIRFQ